MVEKETVPDETEYHRRKQSMEVKKPNKSLLFYAFVVMIVLILLNALVIPRISERSMMSFWLFWMPSMSSR